MDTFEGLPFFRGVSSQYSVAQPFVGVVRRDRRPRHSGLEFHKIADDWFQRKFGIRYRSQALFLTSSILSASAYAFDHASVVRVIPTSSYRFCWSPNISDLFLAAKQHSSSPAKEIEELLEAASYRETDLSVAHESAHEVMLYCQSYVAIPIGLLGTTASPNGKPIVLVGKKN